MSWNFLTVCAVFLTTAVFAQDRLRLCMMQDKEAKCKDLERDGPVKCEYINNAAECAIKLAEGKADFGVFTADALMVANMFYHDGLRVVADLRDEYAGMQQFKFQSVVIVHKNYTATENQINLSGKGLCHPGFSRSEDWNDRALKYFEKKVVSNKCGYPRIENEIANLRDYFKQGCRPGNWVLDENLDKELKKKYPEMCKLCDGTDCTYANKNDHGHKGALDCLSSGKGGVAYVSLWHAKRYFSRSSNKNLADYQFLCENGSLMPIDSADPCTWYKQPWDIVVSREETVNHVLAKLNETIQLSTQDWREKLKIMVFNGARPTFYPSPLTPEIYLGRTSNMKMPEIDNGCGQAVRWCTVNDKEFHKCLWTSTVSLSLGFTPSISCVTAESTFECLEKIKNKEADIISIDSNYGHLARKKYRLSPLMFCHTHEEYNSVVVAAVREKASFKPIKNWADVRNKGACIPEYGGIAWLSFLNVLRDQRLVSKSCKYSEVVAKFLGSACTPGLSEASHSFDDQIKDMKPRLVDEDLGKLCKLCPTQSNGEKCEANFYNPYYGDKGALDCLKGGAGDIALVEVGNIRAFINNNTVNETEYRVLCKNGTLANRPGLFVDYDCALSVTIDSEVVSRRTEGKSSEYDHQLETQLLLLNIEEWLNIRIGKPRNALHVFGPFNGTENLLFKDTVTGLELPNSNVKSVQAYKDLFSHVDACAGAHHVIAVVTLVLANFIFACFI